jgi:uncharacterized cupredoxin-like copper-binding protein
MNRLAASILGAALLAACAGSPTSTGPQTITIKAVDIAYDPATIEVAGGRPVRLTMENAGALDHDWSIKTISVRDVREINSEAGGHDMGSMNSTLDLHTSAEPGGSSVLEFTPTEAGTYEFFCTVPGHKEAGAVGTLIVK